MLGFSPPRNMESGLSLVLATLGRVHEIDRFFASVAESASGPLEVVVVDQNSDDRLSETIRDLVRPEHGEECLHRQPPLQAVPAMKAWPLWNGYESRTAWGHTCRPH